MNEYMHENFMPMATSLRHNKLIGALYARIFDFIVREELIVYKEECALVYWGQRRKGEPCSLADIADLHDADAFIDSVINELEYIQPDMMVFKDRKYLTNRKETRIAGIPDLAIEVWSESNSRAEKNFKFNLYADAGIEHWYLEQDSNQVLCYLGHDKLETQTLKNELVSASGIKFDLRHLAL